MAIKLVPGLLCTELWITKSPVEAEIEMGAIVRLAGTELTAADTAPVNVGSRTMVIVMAAVWARPSETTAVESAAVNGGAGVTGPVGPVSLVGPLSPMFGGGCSPVPTSVPGAGGAGSSERATKSKQQGSKAAIGNNNARRRSTPRVCHLNCATPIVRGQVRNFVGKGLQRDLIRRVQP